MKGYVTLNTLVFDDELPRARGRGSRLRRGRRRRRHRAGPGRREARARHRARPAHSRLDADDLHRRGRRSSSPRALGAARVILARELSLDDIAAIRAQTDVELEVFVHGALCIAYSGQCLTSEAIGGRSANRGACAQACRLPYELVVDGVLRDLGERAYLLSPEDLEASALVPELVELGVSSLKIEGRLKGPEYVAATTALYRAAIDGAVDERRRGRAHAPADVHARLGARVPRRDRSPAARRGTQACDHRGLPIGTAIGVVRERGKEWIALTATAAVESGDGLLVEGGWAGEGEVGGRVWEVEVEGEAGVDDAREDRRGARVARAGPSRRRRSSRGGASSDERSAQRRRPARAQVEREPRAHAARRDRVGPHRRAVRARRRRARAAHSATRDRRRATSSAPAPPPRRARSSRDKLGRLGDTPFALARAHGRPSAATR